MEWPTSGRSTCEVSLKVALDILPGLGTGVGRWQRETARALATAAKAGQLTSVMVFSFGKRFPRPDWLPPVAEYRASKLPGRIQLLLARQLGVTAERICGLGACDVMLGMNLRPLVTRAAAVTAVPDVSWRVFHGQYRNHFTPAQARAAEAAIRSAAHILTLSRQSADDLVRGGLPSDRITVTYLGVSDQFRGVTKADADRVRSRYRLPDEFVLYVGGINERKNVQTLVAAINSMSPALPLVLAGPMPPEGLDYWGLTRQWVTHLGYVPEADLPGLYTAATVEVFPSRLEGFGLPLIEAMAAGTPVLASDIPVFREVGGDAAQYFSPDDPAALASLLRTTFQSAMRRDDYRRRGIEHSKQWTWDRYGRLVLEGLACAAARHSGAG